MFSVMNLLLMGVLAKQAPILLGTAANYVILSKTGITTTTGTTIVGDMGVSPGAAADITGFGLIMDSTNEFSTSSLVTGQICAADYTAPTPTKLTTAIGDMETAYTDAAGRSLPNYTELKDGEIGGEVLEPGLYKWGTSVNIQSDVTFRGNVTDVWVLQIAQQLLLATGKKVILVGGASANNIFWQVAESIALEADSVLHGIVLCKVNIAMKDRAVLVGQALAQTEVTLISNSIQLPPFASKAPSKAPSEVSSKAPSEAPSTTKLSRAPSTTSTVAVLWLLVIAGIYLC